MKERKRFGISKDLRKGLQETFSAVQNNRSELRYEVIPLSKIEVDPDNPRELSISDHDVKNGVNPNDPLSQEKQEELERLKRMGATIQKKGLINAIVVYKHGEKYRVIAGERRFLSCLLIGKQDIQSKIYGGRPSEEDLRIIQWIENNEREDLNLKDRIGNIKAIIESLHAKHGEMKMTATVLKDVLSVSLPQASHYLSIFKAPDDVKQEIDARKINSVEKAAFLSKIKNEEMRSTLIKECEGGASLRKLNEILVLLESAKREMKRGGEGKKKKVGKPLSKINLGETKNPHVVEKLVECVLGLSEYRKYAQMFNGIDWKDFNETTVAFKKLIHLIETENAG